MKSAFALVFLGLVVVTLAFKEEDFSENFANQVEHARNRRWLFEDKCKVDSHCSGPNNCCYQSWFGNYCVRKRNLFELCSTHSGCGCDCACADGLVCRRIRHWPFYERCSRQPTQAPTAEPGSGDFE